MALVQDTTGQGALTRITDQEYRKGDMSASEPEIESIETTDLGPRVRQIRQEWGLSLQQVQEVTGVPVDVLSEMERTGRSPSRSRCLSLLRWLAFGPFDMVTPSPADVLRKRSELLSSIEREVTERGALEVQLGLKNAEIDLAMRAAHDAGVDYGTIAKAAHLSRPTVMSRVKGRAIQPDKKT